MKDLEARLIMKIDYGNHKNENKTLKDDRLVRDNTNKQVISIAAEAIWHE